MKLHAEIPSDTSFVSDGITGVFHDAQLVLKY